MKKIIIYYKIYIFLQKKLSIYNLYVCYSYLIKGTVMDIEGIISEMDISHVVSHLCHSPTWMSDRKYGGAQLYTDHPIEREREGSTEEKTKLPLKMYPKNVAG